MVLFLFVYLDIYCDGAVKGLKSWWGRERSETNWKGKETEISLKNTQNKIFTICTAAFISIINITAPHTSPAAITSYTTTKSITKKWIKLEHLFAGKKICFNLIQCKPSASNRSSSFIAHSTLHCGNVIYYCIICLY